MQRKGIRVLVDGPDLSGKTTLVNLLRERLEDLDWKVVCRKGRQNSASSRRLLAKIRASNHPDSAVLNAAYIVESLFDHLGQRDIPDNTILITEGYVDRSISYGIARALGWLPRLALSASGIFPSFDLAILILADRRTRSMRLAERESPSEIDRLSIESHYRFLAAYRAVFRRHATRLVIDTSKAGVDAALERALQRVIDIARLRSAADEMQSGSRRPGERIAGFREYRTFSSLWLDGKRWLF